MEGWQQYPYIRWNLGGGYVESKPILAVQMIINGENIPLDGIVDSGSQDTIVHSGLASTFKVDLGNCGKIKLGGIGGSVDGFQSQAEIKIEEFDFVFTSPVIFADIPAQLILGQDDFFSNFYVLFERNKARFQLKPTYRLKDDL